MIAAARRRLAAVLILLARATRRVDLMANRWLERAWPPLASLGRRLRTGAAPPAKRLARAARRIRAAAVGGLRWTGRRLRPVVALLFRLLSRLERGLRQALAATLRAVLRASAVLTPHRAICAVIAASAVCLGVSQFVAYRAVEVGRPGYSGLPAASPPAVGVEPAGQAHLYLLLVVALLAGALALTAMNARRRGLGRLVVALGLLSLGVILLVDLPAGLDSAAYASQFSGTTAVLRGGFYAELASAAGLMLGGLLLIAAPKAAARYHARPCLTRISSFARVASGRRRRPPRPASSRARAARSA